MEKLKDETRSVFKKVDIYPRCNNHLEADIKRRKIECVKCGLIIDIDSKANRLRAWFGIVVMYVVIVGIGCILFALI